MVESNGGEKVVVVEGMVVEEESGRVEEKRKEKLKSWRAGAFWPYKSRKVLSRRWQRMGFLV